MRLADPNPPVAKRIDSAQQTYSGAGAGGLRDDPAGKNGSSCPPLPLRVHAGDAGNPPADCRLIRLDPTRNRATRLLRKLLYRSRSSRADLNDHLVSERGGASIEQQKEHG